uniref:Uncharacterized protein n=1 Tax=Anguilla anguilla TaxID=7936 RepID=A0A0E9VZP4_ANGAN
MMSLDVMKQSKSIQEKSP